MQLTGPALKAVFIKDDVPGVPDLRIAILIRAFLPGNGNRPGMGSIVFVVSHLLSSIRINGLLKDVRAVCELAVGWIAKIPVFIPGRPPTDTHPCIKEIGFPLWHSTDKNRFFKNLVCHCPACYRSVIEPVMYSGRLVCLIANQGIDDREPTGNARKVGKETDGDGEGLSRDVALVTERVISDGPNFIADLRYAERVEELTHLRGRPFFVRRRCLWRISWRLRIDGRF